MKSVYIAHPLGLGKDRILNLMRAPRWVAWAARQGVAPSATWIVLASLWEETQENRMLGLAVDVALAQACEEVWLCGPFISPGMVAEAHGAHNQSVPVFDLTYARLTIPPENFNDSRALILGANIWKP